MASDILFFLLLRVACLYLMVIAQLEYALIVKAQPGWKIRMKPRENISQLGYKSCSKHLRNYRYYYITQWQQLQSDWTVAAVVILWQWYTVFWTIERRCRLLQDGQKLSSEEDDSVIVNICLECGIMYQRIDVSVKKIGYV